MTVNINVNVERRGSSTRMYRTWDGLLINSTLGPFPGGRIQLWHPSVGPTTEHSEREELQKEPSESECRSL